MSYALMFILGWFALIGAFACFLVMADLGGPRDVAPAVPEPLPARRPVRAMPGSG